MPLEVFTLLKLNTDGRKASRGLSATAELLVFTLLAGPHFVSAIGAVPVHLVLDIRRNYYVLT